MNPRIWCLDLEMNQPSTSIIQVGVVVGDLRKKQIIETFNYYVNPNETLNPKIIELTGITQAQVDNGHSLEKVSELLEKLLKEKKVCRSPIVWGNGDLRHLKHQTSSYIKNLDVIHGIYREIDLKTIHQLNMLSKGQSMRGGLAKSLEHYGLRFKGEPHNALDDAKNTFYLGCKMFEVLSKAVFI